MEQRPIVKIVLWIIRLAVMAGFYFLAVHYSGLTRQAAQIVTVSLSGEGVPAGEAREMVRLREDPEQSGTGQDARTFCLWAEEPDMEFSCQETGRKIQASALFTEGNPELTAQGSGLLQWEENGCFVDTETAETLFGTKTANGQSLWCEEQAYTVYGTFESLRRTVVLRGEAGSGRSFDMLSLQVQEGEDAKTSAEQLLMQHGLAGEIMDFTFPGILSGDLLLILPLLLAAGLIRTLWGCLRRGPAGAAAVCGILIFAVSAAVYFLLRTYLEIPADMIPTRWSDFSFWSGWWKNQRANLLRILGSAQGEQQLMMLWNFGLSVICNILAVSFYCITPENTL